MNVKTQTLLHILPVATRARLRHRSKSLRTGSNVPQIKVVMWHIMSPSSGRCPGTLWRGKCRCIFCRLIRVPRHRLTCPGLRLHNISRIMKMTDIPIISVEQTIQSHPLFPDAWVNHLPRRIRSVIPTTMKRHVSHDCASTLIPFGNSMWLCFYLWQLAPGSFLIINNKKDMQSL